VSAGNFKENWVRPFFFFGNNPISLIGGALTTASAFVLIGFWVVAVFGHGGSNNPYIGIIFDLFLPGLFILGLLLIPVGIWLRRRQLQRAGALPASYPSLDLGDPVFRHGINYVIVATFINFVIVGTASYRGVAYMDTPNFCGQSCHVMKPEFTAYGISAHSSVACTECHVVAGFQGYVHAKVNGTRQLLMVALHDYPRPIMADDKIPAAGFTCESCHNPERYIGDKLLVKTSYGDDEKNSMTRSVVTLHVGGRAPSGGWAGIHGAHLGRIEYISTDSTHQTIPWVRRVNTDGSTDEFLSSDAKGPVAGEKHLMDCIDCHNRAAHSFQTPEEALNRAMTAGTISPSLPFIHKQGLGLLKASYASQDEAESKIIAGVNAYYQSQYPQVWTQQRSQIDQAAKALVAAYQANIFPFMNVQWGTHPNNVGHNDYPGCFRCHDGSHNTKSGKSITNDCTVCHNLVATDEPNPKQLADLGIQ
jgi:nitrate/TMAO reductase-like tetraheme cytochrome c subunit